MCDNPVQRLFAFLAEKPPDQAPVGHTRAEHGPSEPAASYRAEVAAKLWLERIDPMIEKEIERRVEKLVAERLTQVLGTIEMALEQTMIRLDNHLTCHNSPAEDAADWWKRGECPPGSAGDDLPA